MVLYISSISGRSVMEMDQVVGELLSRVNPEDQHPQVIFLTSSADSAKGIGRYLKELDSFHGGLNIKFAVHGEQRLPRGEKISAQIIIGTPGTSLDYADKYKYYELSKIKLLIVNGAEQVITTQGCCNQAIRIRKRLPADCKVKVFAVIDENNEAAVEKFAETLLTLNSLSGQ